MQDVKRQYNKRMGLGLLAYSVLLLASIQLTSAYPDALWRFPVAPCADGALRLWDIRMRPVCTEHR